MFIGRCFIIAEAGPSETNNACHGLCERQKQKNPGKNVQQKIAVKWRTAHSEHREHEIEDDNENDCLKYIDKNANDAVPMRFSEVSHGTVVDQPQRSES